MSLLFGVTPEGFLAKPASLVKSELDSAFKSILGDSAGTESDGTIPDDSIAGQIIVVLTDFFSAQWELQQGVYASGDPNYANDQALDAVCSITGTQREPARKATVVETCVGTPATSLPKGRVVTVQDTGTRFDSLSDVSIATLASWANTHVYNVGDRVTNSGKAYQCITAGTSAGSGGPTTTSTNITDGTVHWTYLGTGTGAVDVLFAAEETGALQAIARTLANIATPVAGWNAAVNLLDSSIGASLESNPALRARRDTELAADGKTSPDAIRAAILRVNEESTDPNHLPVKSCTVFNNDTDLTDANGVPPHSVEVLAYYEGPTSVTTDQDISDAVWLAVGGGTGKYGNQTGTVVDSQGVTQTVHWSKPTPVNIYVVATVWFDATKWPASMTAPYSPVKQAALSALLTAGDVYPVGESVRATPLSGAVLYGPSALDSNDNAVVPAPAGSSSAPGLLDVSPLYIGTAPAPGTSTPVAITPRQVAVFDASRITFTATPEAP